MDARFEQEREDAIYRDYVTQSLQLIPQNAHIIKSYREILNYVPDTRTGDEIAEAIFKGAELNFEV